MAQDIYEAIVARGEHDAEEIRANALKDAAEKIARAKKQAEQDRAARFARVKKRDSEARKTDQASLLLASRQKRQLARKALIEGVLERGASALGALSDDELFRYVTKRIKLDGAHGDEVLRVAQTEEEKYVRVLGGRDLAKLNAALKTKFTLGESLDIAGGFILEGNNFDLDESYDVVIRSLGDVLETELSEILFLED